MLKSLKIIPFFFGLQQKSKNFNFFGLIRWFFKNLYFFNKTFYFFQNIIIWFCLSKLLKKTKMFFLCHPMLKQHLETCKGTGVLSSSLAFKTCGGFFLNFLIMKWFCFYYEIPIFFKIPKAVFFFDAAFPDFLLRELFHCKILSLGFFFQKKTQLLYPSVVFLSQIWYSNTSIISKNFFIFSQGLKLLTHEFSI